MNENDELGIDDAMDLGDELNESGEEIEVLETAPQQTTEITVKEETKVAKPSGSLFDFEELKSIPGVVVGDIGMEISRFPVERAKFTTSSKALISIVSSNVVACKTHYNEDVGNYICFGGACCEHDGLAKVRYLFPIVQYDTDKKGVPVSKEVTFRVLTLGKDAYDDVRTIMDLNGDLSKLDLLVTCKDEQFQKISIQMAGAARWRKSKDLAREVVSFWKKNLKEMVKPVARVITEEEYTKKISGSGAVAVTGASDEVDFDKLFED